MGKDQEQAVKHVLLVKFKDDATEQQIEDFIQSNAKLVNLIPSMKSFHWGRDVSIENLHQGFTHVLESTFDNIEGIAEHVHHPAHVESVKQAMPLIDKVLGIDFKPTQVHP